MSKIALIVIDVQNGIMNAPGMHDVDAVLDRIHKLQEQARDSGAPVVLIQHDGPPGHRVQMGTEGWKIHERVAPLENEIVIRKRASDSFFETSLQSDLVRLGVKHVVIAGCMSQYCVDTTCRRAVTLGLDVTLVSDAHSTSPEGELSAEQIIHHHNTILDGFEAAGRSITVCKAAEVAFK